MGKWSREATQLLIQEVRKIPLLYDPKNKRYHNRRARKDAMHAVATLLSEIRPETTSEDVKTRWGALRSAFNACLVKLKRQSKGSGQPGTTKVWYFDDMLFICDVMQPRNGYYSTLDPVSTREIKRMEVLDIPTQEESVNLHSIPFGEETMEELPSEDLSGENHPTGTLTTDYLHEENLPNENPPRGDCPREENPLIDDHNSMDPQQTVRNDVQDTGSSHRRSRRSNDSAFLQTVECAMRKLAERPTEDADFVFGKFIAHELKSLTSPVLKKRLKCKILMDIVEFQNSQM